MSIDIMTRVWKHTPVRDGREVLGLLALADWADDYGGAYPAYDVLAYKMRCSERQAMRVIANLSEAGEVYRLPEKARRRAFFSSNLFVVLSGCNGVDDVLERIYKSAKGKGIKIKKEEIPAAEIAEKRTIYLKANPLPPYPRDGEGDTHDTPNNKGGDVHDTPTGDTHDTHDLTHMSPNTSFIRQVDTLNGGVREPAPNNPLPSPRHTAAASTEFLQIQECLSEISKSLPDPFTGIDDLANTLLRNGKTAADVDSLWTAMQFKGNPAGAFLHAIKSNYTPKTTPVPKPDGKPKDGDTKMVNGIKKIFKSGKWYDYHKVSGGDG